MTIKLTAQQARRFLLAHQMLQPPRTIVGKPGIMEFFARVGCIQFDPLDQVGYNPLLVLQSRVKDFRPQMLQELLYKDRLLVDGFDKQLAIYPAADWPSFRRFRNQNWARSGNTDEAFLKTEETVLQEIAARGPLCSADVEADYKVRWPWGPANAARAAMESLYFQGELVIHHKAGTRKYYDLANRHLPQELLDAPDPHPDLEDYHEWHVLRRVGSAGLIWNRGGEVWLAIQEMKSPQRQRAIDALTAKGSLLQVEVEGLAYPCYIRTADEATLEAALSPEQPAPQMAFLAPLDNLTWDRKLLEALFGFEYRWEVYTPAAQRKYGYYVLPVLYGDRFVARFEPKLDKKTKTLQIANWWWEEGVKPNAAMKKAFRACLKDFTKYLGAKEVQTGENCAWMGL